MAAADTTYKVSDLAEALGWTARHLRRKSDAEGWPARQDPEHASRQCYRLGDLPDWVQARVLLWAEREGRSATPDTQPDTDLAAELARFQQATPKAKEEAGKRHAALLWVERLLCDGRSLTDARRIVAADLQRQSVPGASVDSLKRWAKACEGVPRARWLPALLPGRAAGRERVEIPDELWDFYAGHYLTRAAPTHADSYRRTAEIAKRKRLALPSPDTFIRRMKADVSHSVQVMKRAGDQAAARLLPSLVRDASCFEVGEAVNGDGLKLDRLWVSFKGRKPINTATLWVWQDVRSRRILAWELAESENTDMFRLATHALAGVCAPRHVYLDNTRVAANKLMTGGAMNRHRFKAREGDAPGLLSMVFGAEVHFTNPDKVFGNPGAKPIERAFGVGGLHEAIACHPRINGRGFSMATAVEAGELSEVVREEVARHNARTGRRGRGIAAGSFDAEWAAGVIRCPPQQLPEAARSLFLRSFETRTVSRDGSITIKAGRSDLGSNRYWSNATAELIGQQVMVFYDPQDLRADVSVYTTQGRYLCDALHMASRAFNDTKAARDHARFKNQHMKATKRAAEALGVASELERRELYGECQPQPPALPESKGPTRLRPRASGIARQTPALAAAPLPRATSDEVTELLADSYESEARRRAPWLFTTPTGDQ